MGLKQRGQRGLTIPRGLKYMPNLDCQGTACAEEVLAYKNRNVLKLLGPIPGMTEEWRRAGAPCVLDLVVRLIKGRSCVSTTNEEFQ